MHDELLCQLLVKGNLFQWHLLLDVGGRLILLRRIVPWLQLTAAQQHIHQSSKQIGAREHAKHDLPLSVRLLKPQI